MANLDFDPTQAVDPATGLPLSRPIPGMAAAAIPGILGVVSPGLWNKQSPFPDSFADRFGNVKTTLPGDEIPPNEAGINATTGRASSIDDPTIGVNAAAIARRFPSAGAPGVMGSKADFPPPAMAAAPSNATPPDVLQPQSVLTSVERRSGDGPYAPNASRFEENAAAPPTTEEGGAFPNGSLAQRAENGQAPQGIQGLLGELFHNLGNFRDANRLTLLAMAGGLAGSQNWGTGLSRAFTAAVPAQRADIALGNQNATISYLASHGFPPDLARSVGTNPQLMQEAIGQMTGLSPPKAMTLQGPMGASLMQWNPQTRKWENALGGGAGGMAGNLPANWDVMSEEQKLATLDPVTRGMVQTYHEGGALPASRMAYTMGIAKNIWPTYTEQDYNSQKTMANDLEKNTPGSNGGNLLKGLSSFEHVGDWAQAAAKVGGWSGPNMIGGSTVGKAYTAGRTLLADPALTTALNEEKKEALHAGQEMTNYYSQSGGGEGERTANMTDSTGASVTPAAKAGAIRGELTLAKAKIEMQLQKVLSNPAGKAFFNRPENQGLLQRFQQNITKINHSLAQLDPNGPEAAQMRGQPQTQAAPQAQTAPGVSQPQMPMISNKADYDKLPPGTSFLGSDGKSYTKPR